MLNAQLDIWNWRGLVVNIILGVKLYQSLLSTHCPGHVLFAMAALGRRFSGSMKVSLRVLFVFCTGYSDGIVCYVNYSVIVTSSETTAFWRHFQPANNGYSPSECSVCLGEEFCWLQFEVAINFKVSVDKLTWGWGSAWGLTSYSQIL